VKAWLIGSLMCSLRRGVLSRGHFCPKDHQQHLELARFYPQIAVACIQIVTNPTALVTPWRQLPGSQPTRRTRTGANHIWTCATLECDIGLAVRAARQLP
jgi:hypothetical protein